VGTKARPGQLSRLIVGRASPLAICVRASHLRLRSPIRPITRLSSVAPGVRGRPDIGQQFLELFCGLGWQATEEVLR
jgi:hypothetical protein